MARCLVTGHRGYIGSRLIKKLNSLGHETLGIDLVDGKDINSLQGLVEDDSGNFHPFWSGFKADYLFHLACIPRVAYSVEEPVKTMANNVLAGSNVLNFAHKNGVKRVIYSSSSSIRGDGTGPTSPYGLQKMVTEGEMCPQQADRVRGKVIIWGEGNDNAPAQVVTAFHPYAKTTRNATTAVGISGTHTRALHMNLRQLLEKVTTVT